MASFVATTLVHPAQYWWRAEDVPRLTADALFRFEPETEAPIGRSELRRLTKAEWSQGQGGEALTAREVSGLNRALRMSGLSELPDELTYREWGAYLEACNRDADVRGWFVGLLPSIDPNEVGRVVWAGVFDEHRKLLKQALRSGQVSARKAATRQPAEPGEVALDRLVLTREEVTKFAALVGVAVRADGSKVRLPLHQRLHAQRQFAGGRIEDTDFIGLAEAADMASRHAGRTVTQADIVRAAARGEISLHAMCPRDAAMLAQVPGEEDLSVPRGGVLILPEGGARTLALTGVAKWSTIEGVVQPEDLDEPASSLCQHARFDQWQLAPTEPDLEVTADDCRIRGDYLRALADAFCAPVPAEGSANTHGGGAQARKPKHAPKGDENNPASVPTAEIAIAFAGLRGWDEERWKKALGNLPKWLLECRKIPGKRGGASARWDPVLIGGQLVKLHHVPQNSVRARFQTREPIKPWLEAWKTYESEFLDTP